MEKKLKIHKAMTELVEEKGLINVTLKELCERSECPIGSFASTMGAQFGAYKVLFGAGTYDPYKTPITRARVSACVRNRAILAVAMELCRNDGGLMSISFTEIAEVADVSQSTVRHYFPNIDLLRRRLFQEAISEKVVEVVVQGLALYPSMAALVPRELKIAASELIAK